MLLAEPPPVLAELVPDRPRALRRLATGLERAIDGVFGAAALWLGLAILACVPVLQLLSLGYLLEASGRVARSGRLRDGVFGVRKAARVGSIVAGVWLLLWLPRLASSFWTSARLIDPDSAATRLWYAVLIAATAWVVLHAAAACAQGGRFRHFLRPRPIRFLRNAIRPGSYARARDAVWEFTVGMRLPYYFWLGLRGFVAGVLWLVVPITLLAAGREAPLAGILGGLLLAAVLMYLPFLQTRLALENRWGAAFQLGAVRRDFGRAPLAFLLALGSTLLLAAPLYLLKIELIPREAAWLPSLLFVLSSYPARLLCGWAVGRGKARVAPRHGVWRLLSRLAAAPLVLAYVLLVYFTQYLSWYGVFSLYEQHAFLVPAPFLGG